MEYMASQLWAFIAGFMFGIVAILLLSGVASKKQKIVEIKP
jgi:hypothetical protein